MGTVFDALNIAGRVPAVTPRTGGGMGAYTPSQREDLIRQVEPARGRSLFQGAMYWLDQPGALVRNILTGRPGPAFENLTHFLTGGLIPGLDAEQEDVPDWGFWGNLASELPFLLLSGGGAGAAKAAAKAGQVGGRLAATAATSTGRGLAERIGAKLASRAWGRELLPFGRKLVERKAAKLAAKREAMKQAAIFGGRETAEIAAREAMGDVLPAFMKAGRFTAETAATRARQAAARIAKARGLSPEAAAKLEAAYLAQAGKTNIPQLFASMGQPTQALRGATTSATLRARQVAIERLAERALTGKGVLASAGKTGGRVASQGGIRFGIPFLQPKTIAMAGKEANIWKLSPFYWAARGVGKQALKTAWGRQIAMGLKHLKGKVYMLAGASEEAKRLAGLRNAEINSAKTQMGQWVEEHLGAFSEDQLKDMGQSIYGVDVNQTSVRTPKQFRKKYADQPEVVASYDKAMDAWQNVSESMLRVERDANILMGDVPEALKVKRVKKLNPLERARVKAKNEALQGKLAQFLESKGRPTDAPGVAGAPLKESTLREALAISRLTPEEYAGHLEDLGRTGAMTHDEAKAIVADLPDDVREFLEYGAKTVRGTDRMERKIRRFLHKKAIEDAERNFANTAGRTGAKAFDPSTVKPYPLSKYGFEDVDEALAAAEEAQGFATKRVGQPSAPPAAAAPAEKALTSRETTRAFQNAATGDMERLAQIDRIQAEMDALAAARKAKGQSAVDFAQSPEGQKWMKLQGERDALAAEAEGFKPGVDLEGPPGARAERLAKRRQLIEGLPEPKAVDEVLPPAAPAAPAVPPAADRYAALPPEIRAALEEGPTGYPVRNRYLPQQYSDEAQAAMEEANWIAEYRHNTADLFNPGRTEPSGGGRASHSFAQRRKHDIPRTKFTAWLNRQMDTAAGVGASTKGAVPEMDFMKLVTKRWEAHSRAVANARLLKQANLKLGGERGLRAVTGVAGKQVGRKYREVGEYLKSLKRGGLVEDVELVDRAFADWVKSGMGRLRPRGPVGEVMAWWNKRVFKPFVTIGLGPVPNPAFHIRNVISGVWQVGTHGEIGPMSGVQHLAELLNSAVRKIPVIGKSINPTRLEEMLAGNGVAGRTVKGLENLGIDEATLGRLMREHGIVGEEFVTVEGLYQAMKTQRSQMKALPALRSSPTWQKFVKYTVGSEIPAKVARAIEARMRGTAFIHALRKTGDPAAAARAVKDALIDYTMVSDAHRAIRDIVPFAQFTIGQTPRTLKVIGENPRALAPLRFMLGQRPEGSVVPPFVGEQPNIPLGTDKEGNRLYTVGLGTPFEDINKFWSGNIERTLQRGVASMHPLAKMVGEELTQKDLFFGSDLGSYRRDVPALAPLPDWMVGRKTRKVTDPRTGEVIDISEVSPSLLRFLTYTPISRQLSMTNQLFDWRKKTWHKGISLLTGVKVVSVDEDRELRKLIADYLKDRVKQGDAGQFQRFFVRGDIDPELAVIIKAYYGERASR
ncbi:MAG TPA: hypothetical protein VM285_12410, partial [Polyangia bacterium]|nr:hypothetical protein [Polyangia bacterium]